MASEDMREDLIENEPIACIDDTSVDEKTWTWLVSLQFTFSLVMFCLHAETVVIDFRWDRTLICLLVSTLLGGTHSEPFAITTRGSVLVREHNVKQ